MKITGVLERVSIDCSIATVEINANGRAYYLHAEPRMLVAAFEDAWPDGDWQDQRVICDCDGPLLMSFKPVDEEEE